MSDASRGNADCETARGPWIRGESDGAVAPNFCREHLPPLPGDNGTVRTFATGATRDTETGKLDYEAFLNPMVLLRYAEYMHRHRRRSDGTLRDGDDWQQGIPTDVYMKSLWRHFMDVWLCHRAYDASDRDMEEALCGVLFNAMGILYNILDSMLRA